MPTAHIPAWAQHTFDSLAPRPARGATSADQVALRRHDMLLGRFTADPLVWREIEQKVAAKCIAKGAGEAQLRTILTAAYYAAKNEASGAGPADLKRAAQRLDALNAQISRALGSLTDLVEEREALCTKFLLDDQIDDFEGGFAALRLDLWEALDEAAAAFPAWRGVVEFDEFLSRAKNTSQPGPELHDVLDRLAVDAARAASSSLPGAAAAIDMTNATNGPAAQMRTLDGWLTRFHVRQFLSDDAVCVLAAAAFYGATSAAGIAPDALRNALRRGRPVKDDSSRKA